MKHLDLALNAWRECQQLRDKRLRCKDFTFGRQWGDLTKDPYGRTVTEAELVQRSGLRPMTNNLIRQLVKCVVGNFRMSLDESDPVMTQIPLDPSFTARNSLAELDCRMLEEFLISGCAVQRVVTERRLGGDGVWIDNVSPDSFFVNRFTDPRGLDIELIGMLHSMSLRELLMRFFPEGGRKASQISAYYSRQALDAPSVYTGDATSRSFFEADSGRCRVIELWTLESRSAFRCHDEESGTLFIAPAHAEKQLRAERSLRTRQKRPPINWRPTTSLIWHCRFMTPDGVILKEYDSPFKHGSHPFAVKFYPLIDGEVHSLVEDIIDQQRFVNRLITLVDHIMSVSSKGALLVPSGCIPPGWSERDFGRLWAQPNSVIPYEASKGEPKQLIASGDNASAYQMLNLQMNLFQQISGVNNVLQGHTGSNNTSAALFESQVERSTVAILDLVRTFNHFRLSRNALVVSVC